MTCRAGHGHCGPTTLYPLPALCLCWYSYTFPFARGRPGCDRYKMPKQWCSKILARFGTKFNFKLKFQWSHRTESKICCDASHYLYNSHDAGKKSSSSGETHLPRLKKIILDHDGRSISQPIGLYVFFRVGIENPRCSTKMMFNHSEVSLHFGHSPRSYYNTRSWPKSCKGEIVQQLRLYPSLCWMIQEICTQYAMVWYGLL